jgi:hypothetical protein
MTVFLILELFSGLRAGPVPEKVVTSGRYFREFKLSSLESKFSIETRESWREYRLSKFAKFSITNIVKLIFLQKSGLTT